MSYSYQREEEGILSIGGFGEEEVPFVEVKKIDKGTLSRRTVGKLGGKVISGRVLLTCV